MTAKEQIAVIVQKWFGMMDNKDALIREIEQVAVENERRFHHFRSLVEDAHKTFHELVGPDEPTRFQHDLGEDNDPAALLRRLAMARDEARVELFKEKNNE